MKQEELKKNYVLLSKIAKEKKYAQEYLGLLARRGDIGSIRIGKRWYTTREWFSEFLADSKEKKAEIKIAKVESESALASAAQKNKIEKVFFPPAAKFVPLNFTGRVEEGRKVEIGQVGTQIGRQEISINFINGVNQKSIYAKKEEVNQKEAYEPKVEISEMRARPTFSLPADPFQVEKKIKTASPVKENSYGFSQAIRVKNSSSGKIQYVADISNVSGLPKAIGGEKTAMSQKVLVKSFNGAEENANTNASQRNKREKKSLSEWKFRTQGVSPNFAGNAVGIPLFQKFAFSIAAVLLLVLIFQFGLIFKNDIKKFAGIDSGIVAGTEDNGGGLSAVRSSASGYLINQGEKIKENISLSRVLVRAAMEREKVEIK